MVFLDEPEKSVGKKTEGTTTSQDVLGGILGSSKKKDDAKTIAQGSLKDEDFLDPTTIEILKKDKDENSTVAAISKEVKSSGFDIMPQNILKGTITTPYLGTTPLFVGGDNVLIAREAKLEEAAKKAVGAKTKADLDEIPDASPIEQAGVSQAWQELINNSYDESIKNYGISGEEILENPNTKDGRIFYKKKQALEDFAKLSHDFKERAKKVRISLGNGDYASENARKVMEIVDSGELLEMAKKGEDLKKLHSAFISEISLSRILDEKVLPHIKTSIKLLNDELSGLKGLAYKKKLKLKTKEFVESERIKGIAKGIRKEFLNIADRYTEKELISEISNYFGEKFNQAAKIITEAGGGALKVKDVEIGTAIDQIRRTTQEISKSFVVGKNNKIASKSIKIGDYSIKTGKNGLVFVYKDGDSEYVNYDDASRVIEKIANAVDSESSITSTTTNMSDILSSIEEKGLAQDIVNQMFAQTPRQKTKVVSPRSKPEEEKTSTGKVVRKINSVSDMYGALIVGDSKVLNAERRMVKITDGETGDQVDMEQWNIKVEGKGDGVLVPIKLIPVDTERDGEKNGTLLALGDGFVFIPGAEFRVNEGKRTYDIVRRTGENYKIAGEKEILNIPQDAINTKYEEQFRLSAIESLEEKPSTILFPQITINARGKDKLQLTNVSFEEIIGAYNKNESFGKYLANAQVLATIITKLGDKANDKNVAALLNKIKEMTDEGKKSELVLELIEKSNGYTPQKLFNILNGL